MTKLPGILATRLRRVGEQVPYLPRVIVLVWEASRYWTVAWIVLLVIQGVLPAAIVNLTRLLVDSLVATLEAGADVANLRDTLRLAGFMAGVLLLNEGLRGGISWVRTVQSELVRGHITDLIQKQATSVDLTFYETPEYYDRLYRARVDASFRPLTLLESAGGLIQGTITLATLAVVLVPYGAWLPVALIVSILPALYVVLRYELREYRWRLRRTADERRLWYVDWLLSAVEVAAELRLFGLGDHFRARYRNLFKRLRDERLQLARTHGLADIVTGIVALLIVGLVMVWTAWRALQGFFSLGDLALLFQTLSRAQTVARSVLGQVRHFYTNSLFLSNLFQFLELEPGIVDPPTPRPTPDPAKDIRFRHVTFRYPGSERPVLRDFELTIPAGKIVALVGPNGAGKTTLLKLLCRLYDPQAGQIELDGIDLRKLSIDKLRQQITVLFQEPVHYGLTVEENIALGDLAGEPDEEAIKTAAMAAGVDDLIEQLPSGFNTLLGKWFADGTELSVGEWQRLALARAFLRQAPLILLDEPTSAMDPWAEVEWMRRLRDLAADRTAIVATHRLTTAMQADTIFIIENGRLVESGAHLELLALGGRYAQLWLSREDLTPLSPAS